MASRRRGESCWRLLRTKRKVFWVGKVELTRDGSRVRGRWEMVVTSKIAWLSEVKGDVIGYRSDVVRSPASRSALRRVVMRHRGASDRLVIGKSNHPSAGRAAFARVDVPRGGFICMYAGDWFYNASERRYTGKNTNVVDVNDWRIIPRAVNGSVSETKYPGAMLNEPPRHVRARTHSHRCCLIRGNIDEC